MKVKKLKEQFNIVGKVFTHFLARGLARHDDRDGSYLFFKSTERKAKSHNNI